MYRWYCYDTLPNCFDPLDDSHREPTDWYDYPYNILWSDQRWYHSWIHANTWWCYYTTYRWWIRNKHYYQGQCDIRLQIEWCRSLLWCNEWCNESAAGTLDEDPLWLLYSPPQSDSLSWPHGALLLWKQGRNRSLGSSWDAPLYSPSLSSHFHVAWYYDELSLSRIETKYTCMLDHIFLRIDDNIAVLQSIMEALI